MFPRLPVWIAHLTILFLATFLLTLHSSAQAPQLNVMPLPQSAQAGSGALAIDQSFSVATSGQGGARLEGAVERFVGDLSRQTGMALTAPAGGSSRATLTVNVERAAKEIPELGEDESYQLVVDASGAKLTSPTTFGAMHGLQTFLQLVETTPAGFVVPAITIKDQARFPWRGMLIDVSRHFIPLDTLKRNLD